MKGVQQTVHGMHITLKENVLCKFVTEYETDDEILELAEETVVFMMSYRIHFKKVLREHYFVMEHKESSVTAREAAD